MGRRVLTNIEWDNRTAPRNYDLIPVVLLTQKYESVLADPDGVL